MDQAIKETAKRMKVVERILKDYGKEFFDGILVTGSLSYGKNYAVNEQSDIDLLFIVDRENLGNIAEIDFFKNAHDFSEKVIQILEENEADCCWCDQFADSIKINIGMWTSDNFQEFVSLKNSVIRRVRQHNNIKRINAVAEGNKMGYDSLIEIKKIGDRYVWKYPIIFGNGTVANHPLFANLLLGDILYEKNSLISKNIDKLRKDILKKYGLSGYKKLLAFCLRKAHPQFFSKHCQQYELKVKRA